MTDLYAVIGNPIAQSKSPRIHRAFAQATGQDLDYVAILGEPGQFARDVDLWREKGLKGLNITAPFKLDAFAYATELRPSAQRAGAVNCLSFGAGARGDNFDGVGLTRDIVDNLGQPLEGQKILMLGAGGAARGAIGPFLDQNPESLTLAYRSAGPAQALRDNFDCAKNLLLRPYAELDGSFDLIVNATSASLFGEAPPAPPRIFDGCALAYDMTYGKGLTPFLRLAQDNGAQNLADGVGMLVEQAAEAFALWRGVRPSTQAVISELTVPLD